jgi:hypothetical protein
MYTLGIMAAANDFYDFAPYEESTERKRADAGLITEERHSDSDNKENRLMFETNAKP